MTKRALVVGAGIGGLGATLALRRAGWEVRVFERAATPRELGFALVLAPNALGALGELGVGEATIAEAVDTTAAEFCRIDGTVLRRLERGTGQRLVVALRPALHGALLAAVGDEALALDSDALGFEIAPEGAGVTLTLHDGRRIDGDVLIGADGVGSVVRRRLHPDEPPARPSGYVALRGLAHGADHLLGRLSAVMYLGDGMESAAARASRTAVYWYMSLLARDLTPNDRSAPDLRDRLAATVDPRLRAVMLATPPEDLRRDDLLVREPLHPWGRGPVTLLGDAAHPVLPHTGQGAAQALEDAVALGLALSRPASIPAALRRYEDVRFRRTTTIMRLGRRIARTSTTHNPLIRWVRDATVRLLPQGILAKALQSVQPADPHRDLRNG